MITVRRAAQRGHEQARERENWLTFHPDGPQDQLTGGFGSLASFREGRFAPQAAFAAPKVRTELITYVREGTLGYEDSNGRTGVLRAGEFQRTSGGVHFSEANVSPTRHAHIFQICLHPSGEAGGPQYEQRHFTRAQRRGRLCAVASPDGRHGSLHVRQDVVLYSMLLDAGHHIIHDLRGGRTAWLHLVAGEVRLGDDALCAGDSAGFDGERALSLTSTTAAEILLLDMGPAVEAVPGRGSVSGSARG